MESNSATEGDQSGFTTPVLNKCQYLQHDLSYNRSYRKRNRDMMRGASCGNEEKFCKEGLVLPDPFPIDILHEGMDYVKYGSVAKKIEELFAKKIKSSALARKFVDVEESSSKEVQNTNQPTVSYIIEDNDWSCVSEKQYVPPTRQVQWSKEIVINLDSDDEDSNMREATNNDPLEDLKEHDCGQNQLWGELDEKLGDEIELIQDKSPYIEVEDEQGIEESCEKGEKGEKGTEEGDNQLDSNNNGVARGIKEYCDEGVYVGAEDDTQIEGSHGKGVYVGVEDEKLHDEIEIIQDKSPYVEVEDELGIEESCEKGIEEGDNQLGSNNNGVARGIEVCCDEGVYVGVEDGIRMEGSHGKGVYAGVEDEKLRDEIKVIQDKSQYVEVEDVCGIEEGCEKGLYVGVKDNKSIEGSCKKEVSIGVKGDTGREKGDNRLGACVSVKDDAGTEEGDTQLDSNNSSVARGIEEGVYVGVEVDTQIEGNRGKGVYVGVEDDSGTEEGDDQCDDNYDGVADIWKEMMRVSLESSKDISVDLSSDEDQIDGGEDCDHSLILKDDIGLVCRICGFIKKGIGSIIEFQYVKGTRSRKTYPYEGRRGNAKQSEMSSDRIGSCSEDFIGNEIYAHPRHQKQMKPHQVEGFKFLLSNLMIDNPGGCIMAHAPGSGKTFMIISFLQSFMAKYPSARPLVVLPRGILATWKHEFCRWQVENIPLYDFYSSQAESRVQQLEVLQQWAKERSILFLGYKQFSSIVCDIDNSEVSSMCQELLLTCPSILILDEGHTPRNADTDILTSLEKVQTPRKVVLSGTLYQNHVREVFNILNLVRPKFLKMDGRQAIKRRILSKLPLSSGRPSEKRFYELVEQALEKDDKDENFSRKVAVIQDLREMTSKVLHFYKGDFLDELPGLVDFNVHLRMSPSQEKEVVELKKEKNKFKINSEASAVYVHPQLKNLPKSNGIDEEKIDKILRKLDVRNGVKAKFYLNLLQLCESNNEKLLVFSQYLLPLKFLERLSIKMKGYSVGKELFMITGDSDSDTRESYIERFNTSAEARVFFGSIKACGEGISLVGASRILILDVHLNPSVTRQAIGRAFRPGQKKKVYTYRLVAHDSPEEEDHKTCFRKECIAKLWFEWNEFCGSKDFEMQLVDVNNCDDLFLESSRLNEDVHALYRR